jgi:hypothetical protein
MAKSSKTILTLAPAEAAPCVAELNAPGAFRGRIIKAENSGQSSDDLARRTRH